MAKNPTVVFPEARKIVIEDREMPSPKEGQILVKTERTLISTGTETTILSGEFPPDSHWSAYGKFPFTPGYDNVGKVVDVGAGVDKSMVGETVANYGSHTMYHACPAGSVLSVQRDIADEHAVFFTIAQIVMNGVRRSGLSWGESAVVYGQGLLGQIAARLCRIAGARPVFAVDVSDSRLGRLPDDPLIVRVNPGSENAAELVEKKTRGRKADVVFEVTGAPALIPGEFECLRNQGRFVVLSSPRGATQFDFHDLCNSPSFTIIGTHNGSHPEVETLDNPWTKTRDSEYFFDMVADGELDIGPLISHREKYSEAVRLYEMLLADRSEAMGVILEWS